MQHLAVYYSHPHWMVRRWVARFGVEETKRFLIAANERPPLSLRINKLKIEPAKFLAILAEKGIPYTGGKASTISSGSKRSRASGRWTSSGGGVHRPG